MNADKFGQTPSAPVGDNATGGGAGEDTTGTIAQAKQSITNTARDTATRIKSAASDTADRAKSEAQRLASETKEDTANRIGGYSSAMRDSAKSFERQDPNIAWATNRVADKLQGFADYVRNSDFEDLQRDVENIARRHPVAFFGGLFVAGLVIGNLLKARPQGSEAGMQDEENWEEGNASGSAEPTMSTDVPEGSGI